MTEPPVLYRADWVLPVTVPPLHRGEVLVSGAGRIVAVAPRGALDLPSETRIVDLGEAALLPGLVNVHAHPELAMFRGALEDLPFRDWILRLVGAKRSALLPEDSLAAARWSMVESLAAGITTTGATEASGASAGAMTEAGVRGVVFVEVFGPDPAQVSSSLARLEEDLLRAVGLAGPLVRIGVSPHAPYTVSDELYRATARMAAEERLPMAVHIAESRVEHDLVVEGAGDFAAGLRARGIATGPRGRTPIDLLHRLGVLECQPLLIHCVDLDEADIALIEATDSPVAHCPVANAKLGHGAAPVLQLLAAGVRVGLGTDSVASNNRLDLLEEARFTALMQRAVARAPEVLPAEKLLRLCTLDGAAALGMDDWIGSLEPDKAADLCAISLAGAHTVPFFDPVDAIFHSARGSDVVLTVVGGRVLYDRGQHLTIDVASARRGVEAAADRLKSAR